MYLFYQIIFFIIAIIPKNTHSILNQINVGMVFTVDDQMRPKLDITAYIATIFENQKTGIIITALATKNKNSTVLALF